MSQCVPQFIDPLSGNDSRKGAAVDCKTRIEFLRLPHSPVLYTCGEGPAAPHYQCDRTNSDISYLFMFLIVTLSCCHSTDLNVRFVVVFIKV